VYDLITSFEKIGHVVDESVHSSAASHPSEEAA